MVYAINDVGGKQGQMGFVIEFVQDTFIELKLKFTYFADNKLILFNHLILFKTDTIYSKQTFYSFPYKT